MDIDFDVLNRDAPEQIAITGPVLVIRADNPEGTYSADMMSVTDQMPDGLCIVQVNTDNEVTLVCGPYVRQAPEALHKMLFRWPSSYEIDLLVHFHDSKPSAVIAVASPFTLDAPQEHQP